MKRYRTPREVLAEIVQVLAAKTRAPGQDQPLQEVVDAIAAGRHYFWSAIYLVIGDRVYCQASHGPLCSRPVVKLGEGLVGTVAKSGTYILEADVSGNRDYLKVFPETRSELAVPIKIGSHVLGVINIEHTQTHGLSTEDRIMAEEIAQQLALFLSGRGKYVLMKAREATRQTAKAADAGDITQAFDINAVPSIKPERAVAARAGQSLAVGDKART
ncbi:MAG TPA: GAF domain-containing protein [Terriglobales bacterium]|nr:GAF domain-containing protein [Terriglobales bacterium]